MAASVVSHTPLFPEETIRRALSVPAAKEYDPTAKGKPAKKDKRKKGQPMIRAEECLHNGRKISIGRALAIRDKAPKKKRPQFACINPKCGRPVRPHRAGGKHRAHFEHFKRNPKCELSHPLPEKK